MSLTEAQIQIAAHIGAAMTDAQLEALRYGGTLRVCNVCGTDSVREDCSYCGDSTYDHHCNSGECRRCGRSDTSRIPDLRTLRAVNAALALTSGDHALGCWPVHGGWRAGWSYGGRGFHTPEASPQPLDALLLAVSTMARLGHLGGR